MQIWAMVGEVEEEVEDEVGASEAGEDVEINTF
jgi:hypothetical protein